MIQVNNVSLKFGKRVLFLISNCSPQDGISGTVRMDSIGAGNPIPALVVFIAVIAFGELFQIGYPHHLPRRSEGRAAAAHRKRLGVVFNLHVYVGALDAGEFIFRQESHVGAPKIVALGRIALLDVCLSGVFFVGNE